MSHKIEDLQAKTDKLVEEAAREDRTPGEHRQDRGYENNQPTTTKTAAATSSANHHQREGFERGYFIHLSREHCLNYRRNGRGCQIENREGEKHIHQPETNLEIFVTQPASTTKFGFSIQTSSQSVLLYGWIRNLAGHKEYFQQPVADLYQQLSSLYTEDQMAGKNHQQETMGTNKTRTNRPTNMQEKVEMDWTLAEEAAG
ncbi:unnamed protein product [Trichobilharzia szidati]|nr:unnamed protein product [Trichobilharzia szidati]